MIVKIGLLVAGIVLLVISATAFRRPDLRIEWTWMWGFSENSTLAGKVIFSIGAVLVGIGAMMLGR